jgi:hypothetical protein
MPTPIVWRRNANRTYTATINGVTYTIKKVVSDMGGAEVFAVTGSNGYENWGALLRIAQKLARENAENTLTND